MAREIQLKVADAKQRDVGHGKARIDNETMQKLAITAGDIIEVRGKRSTVAIAWPAYAEDQGQEIILIDGLLRRNAGVAINEFVSIKKAEVKDSQTVAFAPSDVRLSGRGVLELCQASIHGHALRRRRHDPPQHIRERGTAHYNPNPAARSGQDHRVYPRTSDERAYP